MRTLHAAENNPSTIDARPVFNHGIDGTRQPGVIAQDLMTELMGVVPILGDREVLVGFSGTGAYCDKNLSYVNIPSLPPARFIPESIARELRDFAAHEAAHLAFTDPTVEIVDINGNHDGLLHTIWNCIEDFMIERNWLELYPGARKNFAATEVRCCASYEELYRNNPDVALDLRSVGPVSLTWLRAIYFGLGTQCSRDCFATMPADFQRRSRDWFTRMIDVETTQDSLDLARDIYQDITTQPFDPNNMPQNSLPPMGSGSAANNGNGNSGASGSGQTNLDPSQNPGVYNGPAPVPVSPNIADSLSGAAIPTGERTVAIINSTEQAGPAAKELADDAGYHVADDIKRSIQSHISAVATHLRRSLKTASKVRFKSGRTDGIIESSRLTTAMMGSLEYHRKKIKGEAIDTAVSILLDCSGSMGGAKQMVCQQLAIALEASFAGTPIKHEILGFTSGNPADADPAIQKMAQAIAANQANGHIEYVNVYEFRSFNQTHMSANKTIGNITKVYLAGTPTGQGILAAHKRLAARPEKRHVMFVLTDGASDDSARTIAAVKAVEACNVTVIGVGITSTAVKTDFTNHIIINNIADLPGVMMSKLTGILLGDKGLTAITGKAAESIRLKANA